MWLYLFGEDDRHPNPVDEIAALARMDEAGDEVFLRLPSSHRESKGTGERELVFLCVSEHGNWLVHGEAEVFQPAIRGKTPPSMLSLHGSNDEGQLWWKLARVCRYATPRSAQELGIDEHGLPRNSEVRTIHLNGGITGPTNGRAAPKALSPLDRLTAAMDAAWDEGRVTDNAIEAAIRSFRAGHPYGR